MAATLYPVNSKSSSPPSVPTPPSATSASSPIDPARASPATPYDETNTPEGDSGRGRSQFPLLPEAAAGEYSYSDEHERDGLVPEGARSSISRASSTERIRRRGTSASANGANEKPQKLTAAEMEELTSNPSSLPIAPAPAPEHGTVDQETVAETASQHEELGEACQSGSYFSQQQELQEQEQEGQQTQQEEEQQEQQGQREQQEQQEEQQQQRRLDELPTTNGLVVELPGEWMYGSAWEARGQQRPPRSCSPRTVSTPPMTRVQKNFSGMVPQPVPPRRFSNNPRPKPSPLNLNGEAGFGPFRARPPSPAIKTGPAAMSSQQQQQQQQRQQQQQHDSASLNQTQTQAYAGPSPPSPIPAIIPLPPMSLPTHLQLELAAQRPSPLYIHQSHLNDVPYESYAVKLQRLKNVILLPLYLERTLYFGALACLDAWLYTFTILPIRFFMAFGVLLRWWWYVVVKELRWLVGYVQNGLVRLWKRERMSRSRRPSDASDSHRSRSRSCARETAIDSGGDGVSASVRRDSAHQARYESQAEDHEHRSSLSSNSTQHPGPKTGSFSQHRRIKSVPSALSHFHKADLLQGAVIICSSFALMSLDASRMYHFIRAQSAIKLYVIYNILEVSDRLLSAIGQDILECLFSHETLSRNQSGRSKILLPLGIFFLALVYNCLHSITLYYQVITLNVAVNSYSNALLTLLLSNQFVEIKSTVFKRFDKDNLFQLTCADIVERFHLWIMLLIIGMRNIVEVGAFSVPGAGFDSSHDDGKVSVPLHPRSILPHSFTVLPSWLNSGEALSPFLIVVGSEMLVDTVKHVYVTKFNNIKPTFYGRTLDILCKDYYTNAFVTPSLMRRLGLAVIPLSCLFIRASIQTYHMFLSAHVPMPLPASTQTSLMQESAVPSSPAMMAALSRFDALLRDSLGRATYGNPYGSPLNARPWYAWNSDDIIAALTMVVVFFIVFLVLLILKLLLGMVLLQYSRNRYADMKHKEKLVAQGALPRETYDASGKRVGGRGEVELSEEKSRWINADGKEGTLQGGGRVSGGKKMDGGGRNKDPGDYMGVARYEMVAKRIW
ncbi:hypothetical protein E4U25_006268 [Claviceps purpurea]|nr:hypothetical protein E4U25_006268 [Claviceps purpurea]